MVQWEGSTVSDSQLNTLTAHGLLRPRTSDMEWLVPDGEQSPDHPQGYMVSFLAYHVRGFAMSAHRFVREVLHHFGVALHELAFNRIQQMAAFVALCEGYLGIDPQFDLFMLFFKAALVKTKSSVFPWGFCSIHMKQPRIKKYPHVKLTGSTRAGIRAGSTSEMMTTVVSRSSHLPASSLPRTPDIGDGVWCGTSNGACKTTCVALPA